MKKKILCLMILLLLPRIASAADIKILLDGNELNCDVAPQIVNDRTILPMRAVFESLGARVKWFEDDRLIFAMKGDTLITLKIGSEEMILKRAATNETEVIKLDVAPFIKDDRTIVPVRAVSEALKATVDWIEETRTIIIKSK